MPEFRIGTSSINKERSKLYDTEFRNLFEAFQLRGKWGWAHLFVVLVAPAKSNNK